MRIFRRSKQDPFALSPQEEREIRLRNVQAAFARVDLADFNYDQIATAASIEGRFVTAAVVAAVHTAHPAVLERIAHETIAAIDWALARWEFQQAMEAYKRRVGDRFPTDIRWFPDYSTPSGVRDVAAALPAIAAIMEHAQQIEREQSPPAPDT